MAAGQGCLFNLDHALQDGSVLQQSAWVSKSRRNATPKTIAQTRPFLCIQASMQRSIGLNVQQVTLGRGEVQRQQGMAPDALPGKAQRITMPHTTHSDE